MEKLVKIAEIDANNHIELKRVVETLENAGFFIVLDGEFDTRAYICKKD